MLNMMKKEQKKMVKKYIELLKKIVVDEKVLNEIIDTINNFEEKGIIAIDGNNLYARTLDDNNRDYLEIKPENNFVCIYTNWNGSKNVFISQVGLKNENIKLEKTEKVEYCCDEAKNKSSVEKQTKIYSSDGQVIYESELEQKEEYESKKGEIVYYPSSQFTNSTRIEEKWHLPNGCKIMHTFIKENYSNESIVDRYSICPKLIHDNFGSYEYYNELDKELFTKIMTGKISVDELFEKHPQLKKVKDNRIKEINI